MPFGRVTRSGVVRLRQALNGWITSCGGREHRAHPSRCRWRLLFDGGACGLLEICRAPSVWIAARSGYPAELWTGTLGSQRDNVGRRRRGSNHGTEPGGRNKGVSSISYLSRDLRDSIRPTRKGGREGAVPVELAAAWQGRAQVIETSREGASVARAIAEVLAKVRSQSMRWSTVRGFATACRFGRDTDHHRDDQGGPFAMGFIPGTSFRTISFQERRLTRCVSAQDRTEFGWATNYACKNISILVF